METGATPVLRKRRGASLPAAVHMPERARPRAQQLSKCQAAANFPKRRLCGRCCGRDGRTPQTVARGGAAFDGIIKFLAAGAAGARALAGGRGSGHGNYWFYFLKNAALYFSENKPACGRTPIHFVPTGVNSSSSRSTTHGCVADAPPLFVTMPRVL